MKKAMPAVMLLCSLAIPGYSQLKGLLNKVKTKVDQRVEKKTDATIDKTLDKAEGKTTADSAYIVKRSPTATSTTSELKAFSKYDFVPGEKLVYAEDFAQEAMGELPLGWNSSGSAEVVQLDQANGRWLRLHKVVAYLTANEKNFGRDYTIEFDLILQLKTNGWIYPKFSFGIIAARDKTPGDNALLREYGQYSSVTATLYPAENHASRTGLASTHDNKASFNGDPITISELQNWYGRPIHVAIQVQKERFRCWLNEIKAFDVPKAVPLADSMNQLRFEVGQTNYTEQTYGVYISNIRIATGLPDTRHKLLEDGRFSTNGILFDPQSAVIRPESGGVVKEIAAVLKENPSISIKVIGHTSSDGDDAANLELSKKRALAVKDLLSGEYQIDAARIETDGKGETMPVADNKTREGRAQNRRVEFIKL